MQKLGNAPNLLIAQHWLNILAAAGIRCELRNRYLSGAMGEIPADQCTPELWLADENDATLARQLLAEARRGPSRNAPRWRCNHCGEVLEPQFTMCWQCGHVREEA